MCCCEHCEVWYASNTQFRADLLHHSEDYSGDAIELLQHMMTLLNLLLNHHSCKHIAFATVVSASVNVSDYTLAFIVCQQLVQFNTHRYAHLTLIRHREC